MNSSPTWNSFCFYWLRSSCQKYARSASFALSWFPITRTCSTEGDPNPPSSAHSFPSCAISKDYLYEHSLQLEQSAEPRQVEACMSKE